MVRVMDATSLIAALGGKIETASAFGVSLSTVYLWEDNGHIPTKRFDDAIRIAAERGIQGVTFEGLFSAARKGVEAA